MKCANEEVAQACIAESADFKTSSRDGCWKIIESGHLDDALVFVDTCAVSTPEFAAALSDSGSIHNSGEARLVRDIVLRFIENGVHEDDIGIMCVYRKQVEVIKSALDDLVNIEVKASFYAILV
ncbi:hypothetical protein TELCIR_26186 [Teladorsagia circumcincta]|uniref:DNA2/NAM7 helicase-like C-terminal domain-containing protein n=1 Tax=Teladorsagia circumcincta TaxID=45464 RepID=A0A2G9T3N4_TELCI|nr:hypothetical protein TELCIR_26186 [Teladorsagia circumcincta]